MEQRSSHSGCAVPCEDETYRICKHFQSNDPPRGFVSAFKQFVDFVNK